jgi:ribonuclease-3
MEEEPTMAVPSTEQEQDFVIRQQHDPEPQQTPDNPEIPDNPEEPETDEFDLSDIKATPQELSREEIIAAAETAAFS